jgi:hypothetical protein
VYLYDTVNFVESKRIYRTDFTTGVTTWGRRVWGVTLTKWTKITADRQTKWARGFEW